MMIITTSVVDLHTVDKLFKYDEYFMLIAFNTPRVSNMQHANTFFSSGGVHSPPKKICEKYSANETAPIAADDGRVINIHVQP